MDGPWSYDDSKQQIVHKKLGRSGVWALWNGNIYVFRSILEFAVCVISILQNKFSGKCLALHADSSALVMRECDDHNSYHKWVADFYSISNSNSSLHFIHSTSKSQPLHCITDGLGAKSLLTGQRNNRNQCPAIYPEALPCPWDPKECLLQERTPSKIKQITDNVIHCFLIIKKVHSLHTPARLSA